MAKKNGKVVILGFDCAMPGLLEKLVNEGHLPNFKKLMSKGVFAEKCHVPFPTVTPPNWTSIATGAWPGTHDITDFFYFPEDKPVDNSSIFQSFSSLRCKAEYLWEAADKAGKKCVVLNYPTSWPSKMENGIILGGVGLGLGEFRDELPNLDHLFSVSGDHMVTTSYYPGALRSQFKDAKDWTNTGELGDDPLEMEVKLSFPHARVQPSPTTWWILAHEAGNDGYDTVTLSPSKDAASAFCTLKRGEWSERLETTITFPDGRTEDVFFKCKLLEISDDASEFRFIIGALSGSNYEAKPAAVAEELVKMESKGCFHEAGGMILSMLNMIDDDTYAEMNENASEWLGDAAAYLMKNKEWDLFAMHSHPIDWMYHALFDKLESSDEKLRASAWEVHRRVYQAEDKLLGKIMDSIDRDTLLIVVSDHGASADGPAFNPFDPLIKAGLSAMTEEAPKPVASDDGELDFGAFWADRENAFFRFHPDMTKCKALPQRELYVYVNLKGRNPGGIVEPEDYEKVQKEIIDALLTYVDPATGKRPVQLALSRRDASVLGLCSETEQVGDVVYAIDPSYAAQHGPMLPSALHGEFGDLRGLLIFQGPGIKKGYRMKRRCSLPDIVPTICYLTDMPLPAQAEGSVLYEALRDPNMKNNELNKLHEALARMETALARDNREPWDKHDCA